MTNEPETTPPLYPLVTARYSWVALSAAAGVYLSILSVSLVCRILASSGGTKTGNHPAQQKPDGPGFLLLIVVIAAIVSFVSVCVPVSLARRYRIPVRKALRLRRVRGIVYLLTILGVFAAGGIGNSLLGLLSRLFPSLASGTLECV